MTDPFDLDFTRTNVRPEPSADRMARVSDEAKAGGPQLANRGFYVAMARRGAPVVPRGGARHTILVVEDDKPMQGLVREVLANAGFQARVAGTRDEINKEFNRPPLPDLILLDVSLPDADGFAILERVRATPRIAKMPVVMLTAKSDVADVARGLALGADGYVTKPFDVSVLLTAINNVLGVA